MRLRPTNKAMNLVPLLVTATVQRLAEMSLFRGISCSSGIRHMFDAGWVLYVLRNALRLSPNSKVART